MVNNIDDQRINTVNETPIKQMAHGNAARIIPFLREKFGRSLALFSIFRNISVLLKCQCGPGLRQHFPIIFQSQQPLSYLRKIIVNLWNRGIFLGLGSLNQKSTVLLVLLCTPLKTHDLARWTCRVFFWTIRILEIENNLQELFELRIFSKHN